MQERTASLSANGRVPSDHLEEIAKQLIELATSTEQGPLEKPSAETPPSKAKLSVVNPFPLLLPGPRLLHDLVRTQDGENNAIECLGPSDERTAMSYADLHTRSRSVAREIQLVLGQTESSTRQIVPLLLPQSPELYVAQLAILQAGCAFCPLNLDAPEERIRFIFRDVSAEVVITTSALRDRIPRDDRVRTITIDEVKSVSTFKKFPAPNTIRPDDTAYVMYTSGSTGQPKGVEVSHMAATQSLLAHEQHVPKFSRFLQFAAPTFDVSVFEIFFPFFRGCTLVCCDRTSLLNDLPSVINDMRVDAAELTPTVASGLLQGRSRVPGLRLLLTIGEMLTSRVIEEFGSSPSSPGILFGMYGPTEAAIHCTLEPTFNGALKAGIIGRPLETTSAIIVKPLSDDTRGDENLEILPVGHVGELAVGGYQLATGYLNRPEQTLGVFNGSAQFGRIYRTGDKARMLPDGRLECLGRIATGQVKLRGQRIELGEIEQVVLRLPQCDLSTASVIDGNLVVFCVKGDELLSQAAVREICRNWLPGFMVPSDIVILEFFPQLPSGKVDKRKLEEEYRKAQRNIAQESEDVSDATQDSIRQVFEEVLKRKVSVSTDLSAAGLDSLLAIKAASQLREEGWQVRAVDLLKTRNVSQLTSSLQDDLLESKDKVTSSQTSNNNASANLEQKVRSIPEVIDRGIAINDIHECTPLQLSMLAETAIDERAYFNWIEFEFPQSTSVERMKMCVRHLVRLNSVLRSGFCPIDSSQSPYALLVWAELHEEQVREVDSFNGSKSDLSLHLLHPVRIDLTITDGKSRALVVIHHALYDGWSIDLIVRDLSALVRGDEPVSRPQFRSVAKYYSGLEATAHAQTAKQYWEERMMDYQVNQLPNFHGRNVESETLQCYSTSLTSKLDALRSGAQSLQVGAQVFCQAALAYLLSCYHNAGDVTFGTVTSGRTLPVAGIENVVGPCLATLPLRLDLSQCKSSGDLLRVVHSGNRDLLDHDAVTLKDIKRICGIKPGAQLFDTLFVWQETLHSGQEGDIAVHVVNSWDRLEFNLTLEFEPRNNDILVRVRYRNSTMPEAQARLIVQQLDGFISVLLSAGDTDLTSLSQGLNDSVLSIENPKSTHNQFEDGLASRVEYWARHHPDQPALTFYTTMSLETVDEEQLTYSELNARANRLAHHIRALGVQPNDLVCVCIEKSAQFYVAVLAIVKTGAGYLPITPQTPRQRIKTMLQDSQPRLCLSTSTSSEGLPTITASRVLELDHIGLDEDCEDNLCMPYHGGDAAYAVFTSGSTGTPKGLLVTQDNLLSNLKELSNIYPTSPSSRLLQSCSQAFDVSVFEIFFAWQQGMCLCSATNDVLFRNIEVSITQMGITHLSLTPTVASLIDPAQVPCVKFLVTAGEGVTEKVFSRWADRGLHQGYGPAETVNICTVRPRVASSDAINNVGWVLRNTSAFVVDPSTTDLKLRGAIGELCFGGDQVCRGYLNRVELTSEKFIDHPEFGRLYRSGDLGRLLADGCILFEGRADDQIKIRGQRVELGEINRCILMQPFVRDCVTILAKLNRGRSPRLISFWVPQETTSKSFMPILDDLTASERVPTLYEHAISQLAHYMIPSNLIPVSLLPQTAQGKIDKRLLLSTFESMPPGHLEMTSQRSELEENSPWSRLERRIATQVAEVLRLSDSDIRRTSSFFNLGLDSISAISLARSLEASVGGTVFVTDILRNPTTARLARVLKDKKGAMVVEKDDSLPFYDVKDAENMINTLKGDKDNIEKFLPCTPLQTAMLSAALSTSEGAYCNRLVFKLNKDSSSLRECFTHVLQRHQIFRIAFINQASVSDPCVQAVLSNHTPEWTEASVADDQQWNSALDRLHEKVRYSLEGYLPPHAMALLQRGNDTFLVFFCHHALYDGSAFATVIGEVESLFRGESLAPQPEVEPFLREVTKQQSQATDKFWMTAFEDFQPMRFPSFQSACASEPAPRHECTTTVLEVPLQELESACQKLSCTTLAVLQAAWAKLLTLYLGAEDVCFGTVVSGRHLSIPDIDRLVAPCFNTIPVRADISGIRTNNDLMKHLQQLNAEALPHSLTSLRRIQSVLQLDGQPLFDTLIILQRSDYTLDESIWTLEEDVGDMDVSLVNSTNGAACMIAHSG